MLKEKRGAMKTLLLLGLAIFLILPIFSAAAFASIGFAAGRTFDAGPNPDAIATADFNGDGKPDLIIANDGGSGSNGGPISGQVNVLLNQENGSFVSVQSTVPNLSLVGVVAVADFNKDGKQDIVVSGINLATNSFQIAVLLGNGDGSFQPPSAMEVFPAGNDPVSLATGDFNGDGLLDVAIAALNDSALHIIANIGSGNFQNLGSVPTCGNPRSIAAADLNGDGKQDIAVACQSGEMFVMLGDGAFHFRNVPYNGAILAPVSIAIADIDGDGKLDIVTANSGGSGTTVLFGAGDGSIAHAKSYSLPSAPFSVVVADVNGDGKADLVELTHNPSDVVVLTNNGDGTFASPAFFSAGGPTFGSPDRALVVTDFDGDGKADIIALNSGATITLLAGKGDGSFPGPNTVLTGAGTASLATADFNGDNNLDFVTANSAASSVSIFLGDSQGHFSAGTSYPVGLNPVFVTTADLNGDGKPDIVVVSQGDANNAGSVGILMGNGDGTFTAKASLTPGQAPAAATIGDFNNDGKADLAVVDQGDNSTRSVAEIYFGQGDGTFGLPMSVPVGIGPRGIASARLSTNGALDLVVYNVRECSLTVLENLGNGQSFLNVDTLSVGSCAFFAPIAIDDLNGDGLPEIIVDSGEQNIQVFRNAGAYAFSAGASYPAHQSPVAIVTGDFDGDGHKDVVSVNGNGDTTVSFLHGLGDGTLAPAINFAAGTNANSLTVGDVNHDGLPDLLVASAGLDPPTPSSVSILLNTLGLTASLSASANPAQFHEPVQLTATVKPTVQQVNSPAGTITFAEGTTILTTLQPDGNGVAVFTPSTLNVGTHNFAVKYSGADFLPKTANLAVTVNKADTSIALAESANPAPVSTKVSITAVVNPSFGGSPTGSVSFSEDQVTLATVPVDSSGNASFSKSDWAAGPHNIAITYSGDADFASTNTKLAEDIQNPTATTLNSSVSSAVIGTSITLRANVSSSSAPVPTGAVNFFDGNAVLASASVDASGTAIFATTALTGGMHSITASYAGDSFSAASQSSPTAVTIADFSAATQSSSATIHAGQSATFNMNVTSEGGFSGAVTFACSGLPALATCSFNPNSVSLSGSAAVPVTVTIATVGPAAALQQAPLHRLTVFFAFAVSGFGALGLLFAGGKKKRNASGLVLIMLLCLTVAGLPSCGGGGSSSTSQPPPVTQPSTPSGTSTVVVTSTATQNGVTVSHETKFTLIVQ